MLHPQSSLNVVLSLQADLDTAGGKLERKAAAAALLFQAWDDWGAHMIMGLNTQPSDLLRALLSSKPAAAQVISRKIIQLCDPALLLL